MTNSWKLATESLNTSSSNSSATAGGVDSFIGSVGIIGRSEGHEIGCVAFTLASIVEQITYQYMKVSSNRTYTEN